MTKKGFTALRYLNEGNPISPKLEIPIPDAAKEISRIIQLRIFVRSLLNFITIPDIITKIVGRRIATPAYPIINVEVLSNARENSISEAAKEDAAHIMKLFSFLIKGNAK